MMHLSKWAVLSVLAATAAAPAQQQPTTGELMTTIQALKMRLRDQSNRLTELESQVARQQVDLAQTARKLADDADKRSAMPTWLENLKLTADLRLRYQNECDEDAAGHKRKDRNRARFRLRFGFVKTSLDRQFEVGFRLASGDSQGATSTNQTFDNTFNEKQVWIDLAYAAYRPTRLKGLTIIGGKMKNPLVHTDIVWDSDVNPEGFVAAYRRAFGPFEPFVSVGYFIIEERRGVAANAHDTDLWTYQLGFNWQIADDVRHTCAVTYYDYDHMELLLAGEAYRVINVTNKIGFAIAGIPISIYADILHNCDADKTPDGSQDRACAVGVKVGKNKKKGDWSAAYKWAYVEAFSTPTVLNDSDFRGSNSRGHVVGGKYNVTDFLTVGAKVLITEDIWGATKGVEDVTTQVDLAWRL
jgi:hypothetical protein